MALTGLGEPDRVNVWARFMREVCADRDELSLSKVNLRAAVDAIDGWVDDNAAAFNQAIPQPARSALTARQKARLFHFVVRRRFEVI